MTNYANLVFDLEKILGQPEIFTHFYGYIPRNSEQLSRSGFYIGRCFSTFYCFYSLMFFNDRKSTWKSFWLLTLQRKKRWIVSVRHPYLLSSAEPVSCSFSNNFLGLQRKKRCWRCERPFIMTEQRFADLFRVSAAICPHTQKLHPQNYTKTKCCVTFLL